MRLGNEIGRGSKGGDQLSMASKLRYQLSLLIEDGFSFGSPCFTHRLSTKWSGSLQLLGEPLDESPAGQTVVSGFYDEVAEVIFRQRMSGEMGLKAVAELVEREFGQAVVRRSDRGREC